MRTDVIGIILAGGRARRLGDTAPAGGKGALQLRGRSFLEIVAAAVGAETGRLLVVAAAGQPLLPLPVDALPVHDTDPGAGPLAAIRDGLAAAARLVPRCDVAFLVSCDLPLLRPAVVRTILDRQRVTPTAWVVPLIDGHPQPLVSAVPLALLPSIERHLAAGRRDLRGLLAMLAAETPAAVEYCPADLFATVDPALDSFRDVDTPDDLARLTGPSNPPSAG